MPKHCFVIGPMSGEHEETLNWLAYEVVAPLLPADFDVATPDSDQFGNVMDHVIKSCDRAHLVIANTTGNNPNVLYEIAVLDAMGRACIPVKIVDQEDDGKEKMPFDRAAYTYKKIFRSPDLRAKTDRMVGDAIETALAIRERGDQYQNPLTNFFGVPLSSFSSAYALARGYYFNLLKPAVNGLADHEIRDSAYTRGKYTKRVLQVVIPEKLSQTSRWNVEKILDAEPKLLERVTVKALGRAITLQEWTRQEGKDFRWVDIPTTMSTLSRTVEGRLGRDANLDPTLPEYRELELDEIEQFQRALLGTMYRDGDDEARETIQLVPWSATPLPG